ncbi:hypothetical protein GCM10009118_13050 [Wandonia haliotis]|uniref:Secreted protein n=1 Tax=Wandonia haliotis TaxID=574963 RepID=A0ABN1MPX0_9FLAO
MKVSFRHRISAVFLAILMLSSSIGVSMDVHFCGGELKSFNFFGEADACEMQEPKKDYNRSCCDSEQIKENQQCEHSSELQNNCCHNETFSIDVSDSFEVDYFTLNLSQSPVYIPLNCHFQLTFSEIKSELNYFHYYHPPPIDQDIQVLYQVFRI